ncbi:MAG: hypothetical protein AAF170_10715 [Bacteroidota bacterium]
MLPDTARFTLNVDAFVEGMSKGMAPAIRQVQFRYAAYAALFLLLWLVSGRLTASQDRFSPTSMLWLAGAVGFGLSAALRPILYRRQIQNLLAGRIDIGRRVEVRLSETDLEIEVADVRTSIQRLNTLASVEAFDDGVLLEVLTKEFLWIPQSAFSSRDSQDRFVRHILERAPIPDPSL